MFEIQKLPPEQLLALEGRKKTTDPRYPFAQMEVGDTFIVRNGEAAPSTVRNAIAEYHRRNKGIRFTTKTEADGLRVVRTA